MICGDFGLPHHHAAAVAREIEAHNGLLVQTGYERYAFAHKSLHEYLCAEYILKSATSPAALGRFDEFANEYAVTVALSGAPSRFFAAVILGCVVGGLQIPPLETFLRRVVIERPDFGVDPAIGAAIFHADSVAMTSSRDAAAKQRVGELIDDIVRNPSVRESLRNAVFQYFAAHPERDGFVPLEYTGGMEPGLRTRFGGLLRVRPALMTLATTSP
jgi:hypothetical protein